MALSTWTPSEEDAGSDFDSARNARFNDPAHAGYTRPEACICHRY